MRVLILCSPWDSKLRRVFFYADSTSSITTSQHIWKCHPWIKFLLFYTEFLLFYLILSFYPRDIFHCYVTASLPFHVYFNVHNIETPLFFKIFCYNIKSIINEIIQHSHNLLSLSVHNFCPILSFLSSFFCLPSQFIFFELTVLIMTLNHLNYYVLLYVFYN